MVNAITSPIAIIRLLALLLPAMVVRCGSATYNTRLAGADKLLQEKRLPLSAARDLLPLINQNSPDKLLLLMEAGMLLQTAGKFNQSAQVLLGAERLYERTWSGLSDSAAALFWNETGKDYMGEDYELVVLHALLGLNYAQLGQTDEARIEFRKVNNRLDKLRRLRGLDYQTNLFAKFLNFACNVWAPDATPEEIEFGYIELKQIERLVPGIPQVVTGLLYSANRLGYRDEFDKWGKTYPELALQFQLSMQAANLAPAAFFPVLLNGRAPIKQSRGRLLDETGTEISLRISVDAAIHSSNITGVSTALAMSTIHLAEHPIPRYVKRNYRVRHAEFELYRYGGGKNIVRTRLFQDWENTVLRGFEEQYGKLREKMLKRIAAKVVAVLATQIVANQVGKKVADDNFALGLIIQLFSAPVAGAAVFGAEKPDLRSWHSLPAGLNSGFALLAPGIYQGEVRFIDGNDTVLWRRPIRSLEIKPGIANYYLMRTVD